MEFQKAESTPSVEEQIGGKVNDKEVRPVNLKFGWTMYCPRKYNINDIIGLFKTILCH